MDMYKLVFLFALLVIPIAFSQATEIIGEHVIKAEGIRNGEELYLGRITQGQTFQILIDPIATKGGKLGKGGRYDIAYIGNLPAGWETRNASLYGNPLSVVVKVPKEAKEGDYEFLVFVKDVGEYEGLPMKWFKAKVSVVSNSFEAEAHLTHTHVSVRAPTNVEVSVRNDVDFGNVFEVYVKAKGFEERKELYIGAHKMRKLSYALSFDKEGSESVFVEVKEKNKDKPVYRKTLDVVVEETLMSECNAIGEGVMLIPVPEGLPYYILYLVASALG